MSKQKRTARPRTYARNRAQFSRKGYEKITETDGRYLLKLVVVVLLGTMWLKFSSPVVWLGIHINAVPLGFLVGLLLVSRFEKLQSDRKLWYLVLVLVTIASYFLPAGIII